MMKMVKLSSGFIAINPEHIISVRPMTKWSSELVLVDGTTKNIEMEFHRLMSYLFGMTEIHIKSNIQEFEEICQLPLENSTTAILEMDLEDLGLSVRTFGSLKRAGYNTVGDLCKKSYDEISRVRNLGRVSFEELIGTLKHMGIELK